VIIAEGRGVEGGRYFAEEEFLLTGDGAADILKIRDISSYRFL